MGSSSSSSCKSLRSSAFSMYLPLIVVAFILLRGDLPDLAAAGPTIGFCYGRNGRNLPSPSKTAQLLLSSSITRARIYDYNASVLLAFANTGIDLVITIPNEEIPGFQSESFAVAWLASSLLPLITLHSVSISAISVGVEVLTSMPQFSDALLPAMSNVHTALTKSGLSHQIKVTTTHSMAVLQTSYPPSTACFNDTIASAYIKPLLDYLKAIGSFFMINAYPYHAYIADHDDIALDYALFQPKDLVLDPTTKLLYSSLFAAQLDSVYFAMERMGHTELSVVASETGWPTEGDGADGTVANVQNAAIYNNNLLMLVRNSTGTPYRPGQPIDAYIFSVFNEDSKIGKESERHWGVFNVDGTKIYYLDIAGSENGTQQSSNGTGATWCVALPTASDESLLKGLNFACGDGNADCGPIQKGQPCYLPNTYLSHASYAYNSYYQRSGDNSAACNFSGTAMITTTDPSYGSCQYPFDAVCPNIYGSSTKRDHNVASISLSILTLLFFTLL